MIITCNRRTNTHQTSKNICTNNICSIIVAILLKLQLEFRKLHNFDYSYRYKIEKILYKTLDYKI